MERMRVIGWMVFANGESTTYSPRKQRLFRGGVYAHAYLFPSRNRAKGAIKRTEEAMEGQGFECVWTGAEFKVTGVIGEPRPK